ncbi:MFS transporter [Lampropedia puyangensis]|uniref:MFS transporter n=1 Tax=Lampropedia puyangensis TaxID=1330072 RepID=A0A4S8EWX7_9BURK|nr:MFS transporter [Lampropedia puyangensis]THT98790.1 MFS transporter [Lampropedia puyangensis]
MPAEPVSTSSPSAPPSAPVQRTGVLKAPGFAAFVLARLASVLAMQMQAVVVAWQVYDMTKDPMSLAYVGLAQFIPMLLLLVPAGDLIDRFDRKKILALSWVLEGCCSAMLWWLAMNPQHGVVWIYGVLVLFGCGRAFTGPALQSLLPQLVPREQLAQALATNSMLMRASTIGGPIVGGFLYKYGGPITYAVCFTCFALALLLLLRVPVLYADMKPPQVGQAGGFTQMWVRFGAGISFIRKHPIILGTISLDLFAVLLGGVVALLPIYAQDVLHVGPEGLGLLRSALGVGEIAMGIYLARKPFNQNVGMRMFLAVAIFGLANLVFSLSAFFWLSFVALMVAGAADMVSMYIRSALVQFSTPDAMRGRVNAVNMLFIGSSNELGEFRAGTSAAWVGAVPAAILGSVSTLAIVGLWMWRFPSLRRVERFEEAG